MTSGGLIGKVTKVVDDSGTRGRNRGQRPGPGRRAPMVTEVRAKGEPVKDAPVKTARTEHRLPSKQVTWGTD